MFIVSSRLNGTKHANYGDSLADGYRHCVSPCLHLLHLHGALLLCGCACFFECCPLQVERDRGEMYCNVEGVAGRDE